MSQKAHEASFDMPGDVRIDYALIASSVAAGLIALIYLIVI